MKKTRSWRGKSLIIFSTLFLFASFVQDICAQTPDTVMWGSILRLKHKNTGKYLTSGDESYTHWRTSGQPAVYATDGKNDAQLWVIKGSHSGDRWNVSFSWPVRRSDVMRLEHLKTGRNLHSHWHDSPASRQGEVTSLGTNGVCDSNDNWRVDWVSNGSRGVIVAGSVVRLVHCNTNRALHSHTGHWFQGGKQEVTAFGGRDSNDEFIVELEQSPAQAAIAKGVWQSHRGGTLNYNTIVWINPLDTGYDRGWESRRWWTHGASRHGDGNAEPHNHVELLVGPWDDVRCRTAPSFMMIQNVDNPLRTGPVNYGDKVKIVSLFAGAGYPPKSGLLSPFKYWWLNEDSRWGKGHHEIVISHPDHPSVKDAHSHFVIEPTYPGVSGNVYQNDVVQIRSLFGIKDVLWVHWDSRYGNRYYEILGNNGNDGWGKGQGDFGAGIRGRDGIWHRVRIQHAVRPWLSGDARADLDRIESNIKTFLGAEAAKQEAELAKAKEAQAKAEKEAAERAIKAAQEEAKRLAETTAKQLADAKKQAEDAAKRIEEAAKKQKEDLEKKLADAAKLGGEALKKAQDQLNAAVAENAKKLAEADKLKAEALKQAEERLAKEKATAAEQLKKAQEQLTADARKREEAMKAKFDAEAAEKQRQLDEATALAEELKLVANLPIGFVKVPGKIKKLAVGLREEVIKGQKQEVMDRWAIGMDDKLLIGTDAINPWMAHVAKDDKGAVLSGFKDVAVGGDGTVYAITLDGKTYRYMRPGEKEKVVVPAEKKPQKAKKLRGKAKRAAKKRAKSAKSVHKKPVKKAASKK